MDQHELERENADHVYGRVDEAAGLLNLRCRMGHVIAEFLPGGLLRIRDRRCKYPVVFSVAELADRLNRLEGGRQA